MKTILAVIIILAMAVSAQAATFAWDASSSTDVTGYRVYKSSISGTYVKATGKVCDVNALTCIVSTGLADNSTYYFVATSYDAAGNESTYSNEVKLVTSDTIAPNPPGNFRSIIQQIFNWLKSRFGNLRITA
jgi:fibronectin type 3 domain-containing protein